MSYRKEAPDSPLPSFDQDKLPLIIEAMVDGILIFNAQGLIQLCNHAFETLFNSKKSNIIGKSLEAFFSGITIRKSQDDILSLLHEGPQAPVEMTIYVGYKKKTILVTTKPIQSKGVVTDTIAIFHDYSHSKNTEKMRRDFVANVSHELRTPLSAINGYAETLLEGALEDTTVSRDFVQIIFNHSQRLSSLVRDLLDLSKLEASETPLDLLPLEILPVIQKVVSLHGSLAREHQIDVLAHLPESMPLIYGHHNSIEQVLVNLIENAIKYTPEGGTVELNVHIEDETFIQIDVADSGIGIEAKFLPRIFERFYRVDKARARDAGGTGLGLAIVKHIVQLHAGEIWVKSTPNTGSVFSFTLPIYKGSAQ
jgi:two-component system, OmpR family, phosphate regulon sensor histidine kinase PhoR